MISLGVQDPIRYTVKFVVGWHSSTLMVMLIVCNKASLPNRTNFYGHFPVDKMVKSCHHNPFPNPNIQCHTLRETEKAQAE